MDKLHAHYQQIADEEYPECEGCKKLRAVLFCETCGGTGHDELVENPCPTCGPLRKALREGE